MTLNEVLKNTNYDVEYATEHQDAVFSSLADSVELLDCSKMSLQSWKIENGKTVLKGWFLARVKLQNGSAKDIESGSGSIKEVDKGFDFEAVLNDDFSIAFDHDRNTDCISIQLQGA